jgi:uncharacterized protein
MEFMRLHDASHHYTDEQRQRLLSIAGESILHGLEYGEPPALDLAALPDALREPRATFVTLNKNAYLRGCIGSLEARRPLAEDVAHNAFAAAFHDPRFPPVTREEWPDITMHISVLSPPEPLPAASEEDLLRQLRPGVDGLILEAENARATFLPSVWEQVQDPREFLSHLKHKAGLAPTYWADTLRAFRYTTESFPE